MYAWRREDGGGCASTGRNRENWFGTDSPAIPRVILACCIRGGQGYNTGFMDGFRKWGLEMDEEPQPKPPIMDYAPPAGRSVGWTFLGTFAGVGGYLGLAIGCLSLFQNQPSVPRWLLVPLVTLPPVLIMGALAYLFKSRAMLISSLITFGVVFLSCGTCYAMMPMGLP